MRGDKITRTVIPAQPGWHVARFIAGGSADGETWADYLSLEPIIAWSIELREFKMSLEGESHEGHTYDCLPLTIDGDQEHLANPWAIKTPDGRYEVPGGCSYQTEQACLRGLKDEHDYQVTQREEARQQRLAKRLKEPADG